MLICILDIDDCATNPCQNGGTCIDAVNQYTCTCKAGYTDVNCQTGILYIYDNIVYFYIIFEKN